MATILKCKMCGGDIEVNQDMTVGKCLFCGSTMTLPRIDSDKKARLFNRANEYRQACDFDKAYRAYEVVLEEDDKEAEAYWGLLLSELGVEYVDDPVTGKKIPTCHRTCPDSVLDSVHYKKACEYADAESAFMYEEEATELDRLQRKILAISSKEKPYDVFICYKESNDDGERTEDSVVAYSIYEELEKRNIRTFMSRVSLEDKLGVDYEPYIYSALSTAKVLLVVSTKGEYCNSVWVKNEWMRFLSFMKKDPSKMVIPVYKDMSPYDFPTELSKYQAQDFGKIGAMQDIVHTILKYVKGEKKEPVVDAEKIITKALREESKRRSQKNAIIFGMVIILLLLGIIVGLFIWKRKVKEKLEVNSLEPTVIEEDSQVVETKSEEESEESKEFRIGRIYFNTEPEVLKDNIPSTPGGVKTLYANFKIEEGDKNKKIKPYAVWEITVFANGQSNTTVHYMDEEDPGYTVGDSIYFNLYFEDGRALPSANYKITVYDEFTGKELGIGSVSLK